MGESLYNNWWGWIYDGGIADNDRRLLRSAEEGVTWWGHFLDGKTVVNVRNSSARWVAVRFFPMVC